MFVVQVTPLIRGTQLETLSYFSTQQFPLGSFISVPIRGKNQTAIVTDTRPVSTSKTALKAATFSLRKLPQQPDPAILPESIQKTAEKLAEQYPASAGSLLYTLLPPDVRKGTRPYPTADPSQQSEDSTPQLLTARFDERMVHYQSLIRSVLAKKQSVMLVVPTASEVPVMVEQLSQGITGRVVVFSPNQTKRQRDSSYQKLLDTTQAILIVTTPSFAFLERADIHTIVIEQSASGHFVARQRPYLDYRSALIAYASVSKRAIILGDTVPRTEDEVLRREDLFYTYGEEAKRIAFPAPLSVVTQRDKPKPNSPFQLFSQELIISVERALEGRGHVFFYAARRGLAPVIACVDCGHIFRCPDSNTPYSLIRTYTNGEEERWFVSSTSGRRVRAADVCEKCGSWRLRERGIGIQQVYDEWREKVPDSPVTLMDNTTAPNQKAAEKMAKEFFHSRSGVLIGTQVALPYLSSGVDVSAIISLDATRSIPTWRADESLFRLLLRLRECTQKEVLVQTRGESDNLLIHASRGAVERFYDDEISLRKMLHYPPYSTFILLTWTGAAKAVVELGAPIEDTLKNFPVQYYNNPNSSPDKTLRHGLIRLERNIYPEGLIEALRRLPPYVKVEVNPERIV